MKQFWLLVLVCVPFNSIASQEVKHAPTVEQCRADQKLWLGKAQESGGVGVANVSFDQLRGWQGELITCMDVDPESRQLYENTITAISAQQETRLLKFI